MSLGVAGGLSMRPAFGPYCTEIQRRLWMRIAHRGGRTYNARPLVRGGAVWQLVGLITRRSQVRILPPLPTITKARLCRAFLVKARGQGSNLRQQSEVRPERRRRERGDRREPILPPLPTITKARLCRAFLVKARGQGSNLRQQSEVRPERRRRESEEAAGRLHPAPATNYWARRSRGSPASRLRSPRPACGAIRGDFARPMERPWDSLQPSTADVLVDGRHRTPPPDRRAKPGTAGLSSLRLGGRVRTCDSRVRFDPSAAGARAATAGSPSCLPRARRIHGPSAGPLR